MRSRPYFSAFHIPDVAEGSPVVTSSVFAPSCDSQVLPTAVTAAGVRNHYVISAIGQQLNFGRRRVRAAEHPACRFTIDGSDMFAGNLGRMYVVPCSSGYAFLQQ